MLFYKTTPFHVGVAMQDQKQIWVSVRFLILVEMGSKMLGEAQDTVVHWMTQVRYTVGVVVKIGVGIWVNVNPINLRYFYLLDIN